MATETVKIKNGCPSSVCVAFVEHDHGDPLETGKTGVISAVIARRLRRLSPHFEHCQLVFEWGTADDSQRISFSTTKRTPSAYVSVAYRNEKWKALRLATISGQERAADRRRLFRWTQENLRAPFNNCGYYCNFLPHATCCSCCAWNARGESYFCAEQVATAMQEMRVPVFQYARPWLCTPDDVWHMLRYSGCEVTFIKMPEPASALSSLSSVFTYGGADVYDDAAADAPVQSQDVRIRVSDDEEDDADRTAAGCCFSFWAALCGCFCGACDCCRYPEHARARELWLSDQETDLSS